MKSKKVLSQRTTLDEDILQSFNVIRNCNIVIAGGGASGTAAAIQAGREGVKTCIIEPTDWLGGMLTSAGVSGIDGDPEKTSGIFREFLNRVARYYSLRGRLEDTHQCTVSRFCYEPSVGAQILNQMVSEISNVKIFYNSTVTKVYRENNLVKGVKFLTKSGDEYVVPAHVVVDATEFGDLMYLANIPYDIGIDENSTETHANLPDQCIQPLTYVAILKFAGKNSTIPQPFNYNYNNYKCTVENKLCPNSNSKFDLQRLLDYGFLPEGKLMINIPSHSYGNDFNATAEQFEEFSRSQVLKMAKDYSAGYIYFMQKELGFYEFALSDEFSTDDKFAKIPYVRESRRLKGAYRLTEDDILPDGDGRSKVFENSIAIGDYPIDIHLCKRGQGDVYYSIPPYQIPFEVTFPETIDGFMVSEKNISVSHIVNGTTRMQPVVMQIGQAVGLAAAISVKENIQPRNVNISDLQEKLIAAGSQIFYFKDLSKNNFAYPYVIKLALRRIIRGNSEFGFKPNNPINKLELVTILSRYFNSADLGYFEALNILKEKNIIDPGMNFNNPADPIKRNEMARIISRFADPGNSFVGTSLHYVDVNKNDHFYQDLSKLANMSIVNFNQSHFRPNDATSRSEAIIMIGKSIEHLES